MNTDEQERIDAINRYAKGEKPGDICRELKKSKTWFFKWLTRFKTGDETWYTSHSRAPKNHGKAIPTEIEQAVVTIRKALMEGTEQASKYLGVGADAILYLMDKLGFSNDELPSASTIKRIVKKH